MAIDRSEDDSSRTVTEGIDVEKISAPDGNPDSPKASDEPPDPDTGVVDGQDRTAYHLRYQEVVEAEFLTAARGRWNAAKPALETEWREYARAHPVVADVSATLDDAAEDSIVTPAMLRIEAADPERRRRRSGMMVQTA